MQERSSDQSIEFSVFKDGSHWKGLEKCNQIDVEDATNKRLELVKLQQHLSFADDPTECFPYGAE